MAGRLNVSNNELDEMMNECPDTDNFPLSQNMFVEKLKGQSAPTSYCFQLFSPKLMFEFSLLIIY